MMQANWLTGALVICAGVFGGQADAENLSIEAMARAPAVSSVSMSKEGDFLIGVIADPDDPDARALASWDISSIDPSKPLRPSYVTPNDGRMTLQQSVAFKAGKALVVANQPGSFNLNGCGEGKSTGAVKTWVYRFYLTNRSISDLEDLTARSRERGISENTRRCLEYATQPSFIELPLDPENVIVRQTDGATLESTYSKVNLTTGRSTFMFADNGELGIDLLNPRDGSVLTKQKIEPRGNMRYDFETYILNPANGNFDLEKPLIVDAGARHTMTVLAFDEQTGKYFVATDKFSDKVAIHLYDARTDTFDPEVVFAHPDFDANGIVLGRTEADWGKILGFSYLGADVTDYWIDPDLKSIQSGLETAFPGQTVSLSRWTNDRSKVLFTTSSARNPPGYYLLLDKTKVVGIGNQRPWINPEELGDQELVYYTARDGMKIPGILTLPPGFKKGDPPPPAVVHPHGGPWARDFAGWDGSGWTQFLATRGFAVLQPQYRGSEGWGHDLWIAGDKEWGQKMQDDKDDGARWMVEQGYAKEGEIAIFGYSYGGYAAFAAAVRPDGPFKCAIAGAGVSNLTRIGQNWSENRLQRAYQGVTVTGMDPSKNTDKLSMPILIYHGEADVRVPTFHATDFYNAVKGTGKAKLVMLKDMGHQGDKWTPYNHRESLKAMEDFLRDDCGFSNMR